MKREFSIVKLIPYVFAVLSFPLFFLSLYGTFCKTCFEDVIGSGGMIFIIMLSSVVLLSTIIVFIAFINRVNERTLYPLCIAMFIAMACIMAFFFVNFRAMHIADEYIMLDQSRYLALNPGKMIDSDNLYTGYYGRYGNNYFLVVIFMYVYRLANLLHIADDYRVLVIINACCIYMANVLAFECVKLSRGLRDATKALVLLTLNPISYPLIFWVYSCMVSTVQLMGAVYLGLRAYKASTTKGKIVFALLSGLNGGVAYYIRPTSLIPLVALFLLVCFYVIRDFKRFKTVIGQMAICLVTLILVMKVIPLVYMPYVSQEQIDKNYPITHWIMMSAHDNGDYDYDDMLFTAQFETKEERQAQTIKRAKENYKELGVSGTVRLFVRKVSLTFADGVSLGPSRLEQDSYYNKVYPYFAGDRRDLFLIYCQSFRVVTLFLMVLAGAFVYKSRRIIPDIYLMMTTVMGGYVFYCLWETKSVYSAPFVPCMLICAALGCSTLIEQLEGLSQQQRVSIVRTSKIAIAAATAFALVIMYSAMVKTDYDRKDYVRRNTTTGNQLTNLDAMTAVGDSIAQEVDINRKINRIDLTIASYDKQSDDATEYRLDICDEDGDVLASKKFSSSDAEDKYVPVKIPYNPAKHEEHVVVRVTLTKLGPSPLVYRYRMLASIDAFPGRAYVNGVEVPFDLELNIFRKYSAPFLRKRWCLFFYAVIVVHMLMLHVLSWKYFERERPVAEALEEYGEV